MATPKKKTPFARPAAPMQSAASATAKPLFKALPLDLGEAFPWPIKSFWTQALILAVIALICYGNTAMNQYAVDDNMVINSNTHTLSGFKGIGKLLTEDTQHGYVAHLHGFEKEPDKNTVTYYRPLSLVTFAVEQQLFAPTLDPQKFREEGAPYFEKFKEDYKKWQDSDPVLPHISHVVNILLYIATVLLLFTIMSRFMFASQPAIAFFASVIFAVHPLHTEVVANIKGRDEILALLFLLVTIYSSFAYFLEDAKNQTRNLLIAGASFWLAYLSKENSITFLAVIPLTLYYFLPESEKRLPEIGRFMIPLLLITFVYLGVRANFTTLSTAREQDNILYNRFADSPFAQKYATCFYILWFYVQLLFYPAPLSWDYNYRGIDFYSFADPIVWVSIVLHVGLFVWAALNLKKRNVIAYGLMFYFITLSIVSNLIIDIGGFVGERFLYQPSVGFSILMAVLLVKLFQVLPSVPSVAKAGLVWGLLSVASVAALAKDIDRNAEWRTNKTLFCRDADTCPNSAKALMGCGSVLMKEAEDLKARDKEKGLALFRKALGYFNRAVAIMPHFDSYLNMGEIYFHLQKYDSASVVWDKAHEINPLHPKMHEYYSMMPRMTREYGLLAQIRGAKNPAALDTALFYFDLHTRYYRPDNDSIWYQMGNIYASRKQFDKTAECYEKAVKAKPGNAQYWTDLGGCTYMLKQYDRAVEAFGKALALQPNRPDAQNGYMAAKAMQGQKTPAPQ